MQQTTFPFEILVHEDASSDNTASIIKDFEIKYPNLFRCVYQKENQFKKQNTLLKIIFPMSSGKYIAFCEGDDYWTDPYKLQKQVDFLEANPEYGMMHTGYKKISGKTNKTVETYLNSNMPTGDIYINYLTKSFIFTATVLARKGLIDEYNDRLGDFSNKWPMGDRPIWLYIASKSKVGFLNECMAVYRKNGDSVTSFKSIYDEIEFFRKSYEVRFYFIDHIRRVPESVRNKMFKSYYSELLKYYYNASDYMNSKKAFYELKSIYGFDYKDYIRFLGSRNSFCYYPASILLFILDLMNRAFKKITAGL
jgi:glycosyltransferase involved in cell wall biosynthesis